MKTCQTCGKEFKPQRSTAKYCTDKCRYHKHLARQNRVRIPQDLRFTILRRDGFKCRYCGATPQEKELTVDHVKSVADGGPLTDPKNLVTACKDCNGGKGRTSLDPAELS
jgi:5-methylcytosine-specific restriction endonuclease McrA